MTDSERDDALSDLVARFSAALLEKLREAEKKYEWNDGWTDPNWESDCQQKLAEHIKKGDPRDVAAYAAFCWHHKWSTAPDRPSHATNIIRDRV